jgi:hypothetical protein
MKLTENLIGGQHLGYQLGLEPTPVRGHSLQSLRSLFRRIPLVQLFLSREDAGGYFATWHPRYPAFHEKPQTQIEQD